MQNHDRAASVSEALHNFADAMGLKISIAGDGPATVAGDMITNILHWVQEQHPDGKQAALTAMICGVGAYVQETITPDDLGPDAYATITVTCHGELWTGATDQPPSITR